VFASLPEPVSCQTGERVLRDVLLSASGHCIPSGFQKNYTPGLPREAVPLTKWRDDLCQTDPLDPEIAVLNDQVSEIVCQESRKAWIENLSPLTLNKTPLSVGPCFAICLGNMPITDGAE
jgi:hypothetical protein